MKLKLLELDGGRELLVNGRPLPAQALFERYRTAGFDLNDLRCNGGDSSRCSGFTVKLADLQVAHKSKTPAQAKQPAKPVRQGRSRKDETPKDLYQAVPYAGESALSNDQAGLVEAARLWAARREPNGKKTLRLAIWPKVAKVAQDQFQAAIEQRWRVGIDGADLLQEGLIEALAVIEKFWDDDDFGLRWVGHTVKAVYGKLMRLIGGERNTAFPRAGELGYADEERELPVGIEGAVDPTSEEKSGRQADDCQRRLEAITEGDDNEAEMVRMKEEGWKYCEIAEHFGLTKSRMERIVRQWNERDEAYQKRRRRRK